MRTICLDLTDDEVAALWREDLLPLAGTAFMLPARLARRIEVKPATGCWLAGGHHNGDGYRKVSVNGKCRQLHRVVWQLLRGPIPARHVLDHDATTCGEHACCAVWAHLEPVLVGENTRRGRAPLYRSAYE